PITGVILLLIVVPFAFWGIQSFREGGTDPTVAKVGSDKITLAQFRRQYETELQNFVQQTRHYPEGEELKKVRVAVLDQMVNQKVF
ncbi:SurA N-terminal domain-containing protein, partial [Acinetobacter baumannii]